MQPAARIAEETSTPRAPSPSELLHQLDGTIEPVPVRPLYTAGLVLLSVFMVLLPLVYVALIAGVAWLVWLHAVNDTFLLRGHGASIGRLAAYFGPILIGATGVFFMIKPIFARPQQRPVALVLGRDDEPLLFAYVERLCRLVGAPVPSAIKLNDDVNASAGLDGLLGIVNGKLILTIGLPLIGAMSLRELTGVLAHELGHFSQGAAMRLQYVIRSVSFWFSRVVYQRDAWDQQLDQAAAAGGHFAWVAVLQGARAFVWLSRKILWVLMAIGNAVSCFVSRQMEYDADRYEARVAGSATFAETMVAMGQLMVARNDAEGILGRAWSEGRMCQDIVGLHLACRERQPSAARGEIEQAMLAERAGFFDTHPSNSDRVRSAELEAAPGIVGSDYRARALLPSLEARCTDLTRAILRNNLGDAVEQLKLVEVGQLLGQEDALEAGAKASRRFFQGGIPRGRTVAFGAEAASIAEPAQAVRRLREIRQEIAEAAPARRETKRRWEKASDDLGSSWGAGALCDARIPVKPEERGLPPGTSDFDELTARLEELRSGLEPDIKALERLGSERLQIDMELALREPPVPELESLGGERAEARRLWETLLSLKEILDQRARLLPDSVRLSALLGSFEGHEKDRQLIANIMETSRTLRSSLGAILEASERVPYPFEHAAGEITVSRFLVEELPADEQVVEVLQAAENAFAALALLYARCAFPLIQLAEKVESALGLEPMADPPEEPEEPKS